MRSFLAVGVAGMTVISAISIKRQTCDQTCDFSEFGCDITLSLSQSACCGAGMALHCYSDGTSAADECNNNSYCDIFSSGSINDCRCI